MEESNYWTRLNSRRVSRRALLGGTGALALGGAAALTVGCGSSSNGGLGKNETPMPVPSPMNGGTITQGRLLAALGIDPHIDLTGLDIDLLLYPYLYGWMPGAEQAIFNNLALNLEMPSVTEFIFSLRPGVLNSNEGGGKPNPAAGEEITSTDVKQSFIRRGTSITAPDKRFPRKIAGSTDPAALESALITPDPYTFQFAMADPFVPAVRDMANPTWGIVSAKVLDEYLYLSQDAFGAGPFQLEEFRGNERIVVSRNPNYFIPDRPRMNGITYIVITEPSSLYSAFRQGQHDVNGSVLYRDDYDELSGESDFIVAQTPSLFYPVVHLKMKPPFDDIRVREALNLSINRDEIIAVIWRGEGEYNGPIQWPQTKWALPQEEIREFYQYNPERAKELLADAGYENGFTSRLKLPKVTGATFIADTAVLLKEQWSRVGITIEIDEVELGAYIGSTLLPGNFEMTFFPNLPYDEPDRPLSFYHSLGVTGSGNWTNYTNPELDKLINAQSEEFDQEKRQQIIYDAQRMILKEHGPQLTLTGGYQYSARWHWVHFPFEIGQDPPKDVNPWGADTWTEKV
jgi:peptide/nickel transport system substrate-binding protein